jgi:hypothetical protein
VKTSGFNYFGACLQNYIPSQLQKHQLKLDRAFSFGYQHNVFIQGKNKRQMNEVFSH